MFFRLKIFFIILFTPSLIYSQDSNINLEDSETIDSLGRQAELIVTDTLVDRPHIATLYSAVLPGLGQIYNNSPWKIPIIYGGFVLWGYIINYNNNAYVEARAALFAELDGDSRTEPMPPLNAESRDALERRTDVFRRNRDLAIIATIGWYLLNVVEAHVDAHLSEFTISEDLSFNLQPNLGNYMAGNYGVSLIINF